MNAQSWVDLKQDADTGIEVIRAHFEGHAYDPHWHDSYLIGFTEQGVQQFHCRRALFSSVPGQTFFLEPGDIHDGHAPTPGGFTYSTLYLEPAWLERALPALFEQAPADCLPGVPRTQPDDPGLLPCIANALQALNDNEPRMVRDAALDTLLERISRSLHWRQRLPGSPQIPRVALRARDYRPPLVCRTQVFHAARAGAEVSDEVRPALREDVAALCEAAIELNEYDLHVPRARVHLGWLQKTVRRRLRDGRRRGRVPYFG